MSDIRFNRWLHQSGTGGVYQDSTGRVGIGTSVPTSALDVQSGTIKIGNNTLSSSGVSTFSSGIVISAGTTAAPSISPSGDSNTGIFFLLPIPLVHLLVAPHALSLMRAVTSTSTAIRFTLMRRITEWGLALLAQQRH